MSPQRELPDSHEIDALSDLERSEGYKLFCERVDDLIATKCRELEGDLDEVKSAKLRGQIKALRDVLTIPKVLKGEIADAMAATRRIRK